VRAARVDAEVHERRAEVRAVEPHPGAPAQQRPLKQGHGDEQLLGGWQDVGGECRDVGLERLAGSDEEVLGEAHAQVPLSVLLLEHAPVAAVAGRGRGAHDAAQLEPGVVRAVGQDHGTRAHAEDTVGKQHLPLLADIVLRRQDLRGHDQDVRARLRHLQDVLREADGDQPRTAAHPGKVHVLHAGVGAKMLQLTITASMVSSGLTTLLLANSSSMAEKMTSSASSRAARRLRSGGM
jgi:hypothetical protein